MIYNIEIFSQEDALEFYDYYMDDEKVLLISISDKVGDLVFEQKHNIIVHQSYFQDFDRYIEGYKIVDMDESLGVKEAVDKAINEGITHIIVHCYAGISRSGAVGCVIARYLNKDDIYLWKSGGISPNKLVYKFMCNAFGIKYTDEEFKYRQRVSNRVLGKRFSDYGVNIDDMFPYKDK